MKGGVAMRHKDDACMDAICYFIGDIIKLDYIRLKENK